MHQSQDGYAAESRRVNHERADEMRAAINDLVDRLDSSFSGTIGVEAPVLRGRIGKVKAVTAVVVSD